MSELGSKFAIMAVDPGETTGVAFGMFNAERARTTRGLLRRAIKKNAIRVEHIVTPEGCMDFPSAAQAQQLYNGWLAFKKLAMDLGVPVPYIQLVIEDFQLRQRSANLSPVEVTHGLLALLRGSNGTWAAMSLRPTGLIWFQQPAEAKTYATDARLREWGLWTVGKEHGRDATRHLALRASKMLP